MQHDWLDNITADGAHIHFGAVSRCIEEKHQLHSGSFGYINMEHWTWHSVTSRIVLVITSHISHITYHITHYRSSVTLQTLQHLPCCSVQMLPGDYKPLHCTELPARLLPAAGLRHHTSATPGQRPPAQLHTASVHCYHHARIDCCYDEWKIICHKLHDCFHPLYKNIRWSFSSYDITVFGF